jgi:hypothetical protein
MVDTTRTRASNRSASARISEAGAPEIEITPAMIDAGASEFLLFEAADAEVAAYSAFTAMLAASPRFRNFQVVQTED